jgi:ATP/ADP translocase
VLAVVLLISITEFVAGQGLSRFGWLALAIVAVLALVGRFVFFGRKLSRQRAGVQVEGDHRDRDPGAEGTAEKL